MSKLKGLLSNNNKRLKFCIVVLGINFISFWLGMYFQSDLTELGVGLAALNSPLYVYILGETYRPSVNNERNPEV